GSSWSSGWFFVCLLLLRPPRPTLFPYTTLFRSCRIEQIATDGFNAPGLQTLAKLRRGEAGNGDDTAGSCRQIRGGFGHARESWSHLPALTQNENVTRQPHECAERGRMGLDQKKVDLVNS